MGETPSNKSADQPLDSLLQSAGLWRASSIDCHVKTNCSSGFSQLDQELPGSGWPSDGITEILHDQSGIGEFRLLGPALARLSQSQNRWLHLVSPPYIPYPPALLQAGIDLTRIIVSQPKTLKDYLWVLEKSLSSQSCSAVIAWPAKIHNKQIRRLQLASKEGNCWGILFRSEKMSADSSPAELRIRLRPAARIKDSSAVSLKILKRRGKWESDDINIEFSDQLQRPMPGFNEMIVRDLGESSMVHGSLRDEEENFYPGPTTPDPAYEYQ
jgi:cell division inhibitor SulA